ncbi:MAG TPA: universal stress protein [Candidatus Binataceae bacterium]|nr:universal stress protein [Candidatus Binataceae bacterium]
MAIFKRILCPMDFDANSNAALALAQRIAVQNHASIHLVHIVPLPPPGPEIGAWSGMLARDCKKKLEQIARRKLGDKVQYEVHVKAGRPDVDVLNAVKRLRADLVVMATHGRSGLKRFFLGSVAEKVVREAGCPVLTVRA